MTVYAGRDAIGLALAAVEGDDELMDALLSRYSLQGDELALVCTLAALVGFGRDHEEVAADLFELALDNAAR